MNRTSLIFLLATSMAATIGCASKNYVRQQTTPLINKTNELDDLTAQEHQRHQRCGCAGASRHSTGDRQGR